MRRSAADQVCEAVLMGLQQMDRTRQAGDLTLSGTIDAVRFVGAGVAMRALHWLDRRRGAVSSQPKAEVTTLSPPAPRPAHRRSMPLRHFAVTSAVVARPTTAAERHPAPSPPAPPGNPGQPPRGTPPLRAPVAALAVGILLGTIVVATAVLPGDVRTPRADPAALATATARPTATTAATATPGALPGFAIYADPKADFTLQYPATWKAVPKDSGVEFYTTDTQETEYVVDVLPEGGASTTGVPNDPTEASQWVDLALQGVQQQESVQNFLRVTGPLPAVTIGGQTWQSGTAVFDVLQLHSRVQVYATLYQGTPYVITLLAPDASFTVGDRQYFKTMLATFQFVPTSPPS
jgi:hypothetical protein